MAWQIAAAAGINTLGSLWGIHQNNRNIDKQLAAQRDENQLTREYNLGLAKLQNQWNLEQWNRENAYNDPSAQMARMRQAGLNPDMMYGGGVSGNLAASSPGMTSGAPGTPVDWSALSSKKTVMDALLSQKNLELMDAQIDNVQANSRKTLAEAGLSEISIEYADAKERIGLKLSEQEYENIKQDYELGVKAIERASVELEGLTLDNANKMVRNAFEAELLQTNLKKFATELKITEAQAANAERYYAAQMLGLEADNAWKDAAWIVQQKDGTATLIKYGSEALNTLLGNLHSFIPKRKKKNITTTKN